MSACKTLSCLSLSSPPSLKRTHPPFLSLSSLIHPTLTRRCYTSELNASSIEESESQSASVQHFLTSPEGVSTLMKMERKPLLHQPQRRWFPYLDTFRCRNDCVLTSAEVIDVLAPCISEVRKQRFGRVIRNRSYSVCLVVEGLCDFGNVSAAFRSADALGVQSVHVVSCDTNKRYKDNRHVSMGAEKWLDIELWDSTKECFKMLKSRGYRIATTHVGMDAVSIHDLDWSCPTAIVVGNENRGISDEALELSDLHCCIPMTGMVDSFNVSVAAGILMHHAVCDRISRSSWRPDSRRMPNSTCRIFTAP
ncbi:uncharacterized protein LOC113862933 isoform X2 [Abrus precatorius]|uniref:Uncharacterized protein LOC113862933 isoform X2 n=1 Tax=Abrus precatorius TaxID=3816 RepID=A0A8B8L6W0_ABRPR|nr:uncharacterized protein LOC113862933 isoform X2 [Abrus precatorius]